MGWGDGRGFDAYIAFGGCCGIRLLSVLFDGLWCIQLLSILFWWRVVVYRVCMFARVGRFVRACTWCVYRW